MPPAEQLTALEKQGGRLFADNCALCHGYDARGDGALPGLMTPAARREIHLALADDPGVETESDGEGFLKRVVVRPRRRR